MTEAAEKKDVQKLQRVIVDALEDVKAVQIAVYNTEHLSSLFERVILASGTSNRQTKALAAHVRDEVRKSGHGKPRIEGEENGEWIIVDCGAAVVHIMQPNIREYYNLEEIWGDKPVRLKFGAPKPVFAKAEEPKPKKKAASASSKTSSKSGASKSPAAADKKGGAKLSAGSKAKRPSKGSTRGLQTPVDPKTGLTVPVNNSRRAIDKRPYLAQLPQALEPKGSAAVKTSKKTSSSPSKASAKTSPKVSAKSSSKSTAKSTTAKPRSPATQKPASKKPAPKRTAREA